MNVVNVYEAKNQLSKLLERASNGEEIILGKSGKPLARLIPFKEKKGKRLPGRLKGKIDISEDFDETPEWLTNQFEGNKN